jgi:hypothetical protein
MSESWPWLLLAGLGMYHGLNPAMGWLFAVALGLHRGSRGVVLRSLIPIALGHALAIAIAAAVVVTLGIAIDPGWLSALAGAVLFLWALYHALYGTRHRTRVGMRAGFAGLFFWSFAMAGAHGAGLMLMPALLPLCLAAGAAPGSALTVSLLAVGVHTAAMLVVTAVVALLVYDWLGLAFLRRGWFNLDRLWTAALFATGLALLLPAAYVKLT